MAVSEANKYIVEVEKATEAKDGKPSIGPVYRNILAKHGFRQPPQDVNCPWDSFCKSVNKYPNNRMLGEREMINEKAGRYGWLTYNEVYDLAVQVGSSIRSRGVTQGGRCGIYGANCSQWIISMQACNAHGLYCVPLYDTLGALAVEYIICHADVSIVFVEDRKISEVLKTLHNTGESLKTIVSFTKVTETQKHEAAKFGSEIYSWDDFLLLGKNERADFSIKKKTDICTIMYTSGTAGDPKGVMISNESVLSIISGIDHHLENMAEQFSDKDVFLSYLPLAHIFDRVMEEYFISKGASIGFWHKDIKQLIDDIKELKPTVLCAVPRVLDRIYSGLVDKISSSGFLRQAIFKLAYSYKLRYMRKGYKHDEAAPLFDKLVFNKIKEGLGGNLRLILSGDAPLSSNVETFLRVATCAHVLQGYGLTETCAASFTAWPDELSMVGTVGPPLPVVDVRLESVPEMGYDALSSTARGEICIRGKCLFSGYYKLEDLAKQVLIDDEWFHTGDIGEWQRDGSMKIIDRKKNLFKLSQGEYISVEHLESIYALSPSVDAIWIYGNSFESFLVAIVNPNMEVLKQWAEANGVSGDMEKMCQSSAARNYILEELTKMSKENKLKGFEYIKAVHVDPIPFETRNDLLTPTFKKKRNQFLKYYQSIIDEMYITTKSASR